MRKLYTGFLLIIMALLGHLQASSQVVISQVYGGGGNSGAFYRNDFIELFNRGTAPVDITGWSVQYASATGSSWQVTVLTGTLAPGQYYLVQQAAGTTAGTTDLPAPDATGNINMSGTAGKVALVSGTAALTEACPAATAYIDLVGFGTTAGCFEGSGRTPAPSNTLAVLRGSNGCDDTNNNNTDFATGAPTPRNTAAAIHNCSAPPSAVVSVAAGNNAAEPSTNGSFEITLSEPAPAGGVQVNYSLGGSASAGSDYTDPQAGIIQIAQGSSSGTIVVNVIDDAISEPSKTIEITITGVNNSFTIGVGTAVITLTDDDIPGALPLSTTYSQNFNTLAVSGTGHTWADNFTIPGWYASRVVYNAANGSSNAGALYSFGETGSSDRALGSVGSGSTSTVYYGVRLKNNTGGPILALKIIYTGEQWRNGGNAAQHTVILSYQSGATVNSLTTGTWTAVPDLNFTGPVASTTAAQMDGNLLGTNATIINYTISGLNIPAGEEFMIRWEDPDNSGADHGLGIDDFSIEANPVDLTPPAVTAFSPAANAVDVATNITISISLDETVQKGTGNIVLRKQSDQSIVQTWDVSSAAVQLAGNTLSWQVNGLEGNTVYYLETEEGIVKDLAGNNLPAVTGGNTWSFQTGTRFFVADFNNCGSNLSDGFTQYSTTGNVVWACTPFGRDPNAPAGTAAYPTAVQINGFSGGTNTPNVDWLISPAFNLTNTTYPLLSFWSRTAFNGLPLQVKISANYTGGDPASATWHDLNGRLPQQASNTWTLSENINLSAYKNSSVHIAWVYTSSDEDGARWTIDDVSLSNSPVPPPPSLTLGTSDIQFSFVASGNTTDRNFILTGNDLTEGFTLNSTTNFLLSKTGSSYSSSIQYSLAEANNTALQVWVRFAPDQNNQNFTGKITIAGSGLEDSVNLHGTSINPLTTLEVVNWNVEWFGSTGNGPTNEAQQEQNVRTILQNINADVYGLVEIVDESKLASVVSQMPGFAYVISDFGSHTNPFSSQAGPLADAQKLAFIYKTSVLSNITAEPLLSVGINTAEDISNPNYNYWSSGRFPYMLTADVTLNCVTQRVRFVLVHAKANTSPTATSYERRKNGADSLYNKLNTDYADDNIIILGDFNDDFDVSITAGFTTTSWDIFTTDAVNYSPITLPLSLAGKKSTVSYNDMIDHVVISNELQPYYMPGTASVLTDVTSMVSNYGNSTSDHYPVFSRYRFANTTAPVVETCPPAQQLCYNSNNHYEIPSFIAVDDCDQVTYSYVISGSTQRSGTGNDASGAFEAGTSIIAWTATDSWGNNVTCSTTVNVLAAPIVNIADAYALPSGTAPNTVYIGYSPASAITLQASVVGGNSGHSFSWSTGTAGSSATVRPTVNTTYTVTVTDANGCQGKATKNIVVKDIRSGQNQNKVLICQRAGNRYLTLELPPAAIPAMLSQGAQLGACDVVPAPPRLDVLAQPNPTSYQFTIRISGGQPGQPVSLKVMNLLGRVIEQRQGLVPGQNINLGANYGNGIYFLEAVQGNQRVCLTLVKIGW